MDPVERVRLHLATRVLKAKIMGMTHIDAQAICLKATPYREADYVVSFYSAEHGELRAIAKGVKKATSKLAGACEALTLNRLFLATGRNLHTLCHYERVASFSHLRSDLERMAVASICTEIIRRLGRENDPESPLIFSILSESLSQLNDPAQDWVSTSLVFHQEMLRVTGYTPILNQCVSCDIDIDLQAYPYYAFSRDLGGVLCHRCEGQISHVIKVNVSSVTLGLLSQPHQLAFQCNALKAHRFLAYYWGHRIEQPLKSFDFLFQLFSTPMASPQAELALETHS